MQTIINLSQRRVFRIKPLATITLAAIICLCLDVVGLRPPPAHALDISTGPITGRLDTTVSTGTAIRVDKRDEDLIGAANGGNLWSINSDDGNLNFSQGDLVSLNAKVLHELDVSWRNFGFFGRMYYFYDWAIMKFDPDRTAFTQSADRHSGANIKGLDAYLTGNFKLPLDVELTLRVGNEVLNWGESTFIQNGINIINPVDVSALRVAGAELREALLPVPMISLNAGITRNWAIEGFYQFYWENTEIEPLGTFFSTSDIASPGASQAFLKFGKPFPYGPLDYPLTHSHASLMAPDPLEGILQYSDPLGDWIPKEHDVKPSNQGQGGVALRYFAPWLYDTEFGLYYIHYHSRLPLVSGHTGPDPGWEGILQGIIESYLGQGTGFASTSYYFREFPEDIDLVGASFNADIGSIALAVQGEISYRPNQPIQVDDVELLFSAFSALDPYLKTLKGLPPDAKIFANSQLGQAGFNQDIAGYRRKEMLQPQITLTKILGPTLGTDQLVLLGEFGATWILDMEYKSELRYDGPGTVTSGNPWFTTNGGTQFDPMRSIQPATQEGGFADDFSWGYRLAARADFNNAVGPVTLQPSVAFSHDVKGTTPLPIGNFVEDRMIITLTLGATYLNVVRASLSYTNYFGGGDFNLLHDRDFVSVAASVSF